jgi:flagellar hook-associated protein 1 FlgK
MSDFAALNTALSGLITHRRASEQIGHNIANVNTAGYSRTRVDLTSLGAGTIPAMWATPRTQGDGVEVAGLLRIRDEFLEKRYLTETGTAAKLSRTQQLLGRIEGSFPEPGDTGLAGQLASFWAGWDDVANNPSSLASRSQLLERGATIAQSLNRSASELTSLRTSVVSELGTMVQQVNATLARISELNSAIQSAVNADMPANDLQDKRDVLIEQVAKLTGATTRDGANGMVDVVVGGTPLVSGIHHNDLAAPAELNPPTGDATLDAVGWAKVSVSANGYQVGFTGGEMGALIDGANRILPGVLDQVNGVAAQLASTVNSVHAAAWGLNDVGAAPGRAFFALTTGLGAAAGIRLSDATDTPPGVAGMPANVAVSNGAGLLDGTVAQQLAKLHDAPVGADASYRAMIATLGVEAQTTQARADIQARVTSQVDGQRKAVSGVNLDEEMINLTMTQHAYSASAKLMKAIDEMITTLINLGR